MSDGSRPLAKLLGSGARVPTFSGGVRRYVNLDNAATTPPLQRVWDKLSEIMPWYGSVHRGAGVKSRISTRLFGEALERIFAFSSGYQGHDLLVLGTNTTACVNHLARRLNFDADSVVVTSELEHSSNILPWRKYASVLECRTSPDGMIDLNHLEGILKTRRARLVAVSAASNVTGKIFDAHSVARVAHKYGAKIFVDAAQLVAHRRLDRRPPDSPEHLDFLAFAGHKMYAPFGAAALVGSRSLFSAGWSDQPGGGTIKLIDGEVIVWTELPGREQGGTPNYPGVIALAEACAVLDEIGFEKIAEHEFFLNEHAARVLAEIPGVTVYRPLEGWSRDDIAIFPFNVDGYHHSLVSAYLGTECAIGVRSGHLCQYELIRRFVNVLPSERERIRREVESGDSRRLYGVVRASCGLGTTTGELTALAESLRDLVERGVRASYEQSMDGEYKARGWEPFLLNKRIKIAGAEAAHRNTPAVNRPLEPTCSARG